MISPAASTVPEGLARLIELAPSSVREALRPADWRALEARYAEPPRAYHNLRHILEVCEQVHELPWRRPAEVFCAALFHDAVYRPLRKDNERRSADLARQALAASTAIDLAVVEELILLTSRHGRLNAAEISADAARFLDADMSILGAPPNRYLEYAVGVAAEYGALPRFLYRRKRAQFLRSLLARPRIFLSDGFHARLDAAARANLNCELASSVSPASRACRRPDDTPV